MPWRPTSKCSQASCFCFLPSNATLNVIFPPPCSQLLIYFNAQTVSLYACFWVTMSIPYFYYKDYAIVPPCLGRDLCLFVFLNSSQFLIQSCRLEPKRQSCKTPDRLELLQSKASNEPLGTKASIPPSCLPRRRQHMWHIDNCMLECSFYSSVSSCAFSSV